MSIELLRKELSFSLRQMRKHRLISFISIFCLTLSIGSAVLFFGVLRTFFEPIPIDAADRLVIVGISSRLGPARYQFSFPLFEALRTQSAGVLDLFAWARRDISVRIPEGSEESAALLVSPNYFRALHSSVLLGRDFATHEAGEGLRIVLTESFWRTRYDSRPTAIGSTIFVDGLPATIVGVAPAAATSVAVGFHPSCFISLDDEPLISHGYSQLTHRDSWWLAVMGQRRTALSQTALQHLLGQDWRRILPQYGPLHLLPSDSAILSSAGLTVEPGLYGLSLARQSLQSLAWAVVFVIVALLVVTLANVGGTLVAKHIAASLQDSIRLALGATYWRIALSVTCDCFLLSSIAAVISLFIEHATAPYILSYLPVSSRHERLVFSMDWVSFVAAFGIVAGFVIVSAICSFVGAQRLSTTTLLAAGSRTTSGRLTGNLSGSLVVLQSAASFVVLTVMLMSLVTVYQLQHERLGFDPYNVYTFLLNVRALPERRDALARFYQAILSRIQSTDGTLSAGLIGVPPVRDWSLTDTVEGDSVRGEHRKGDVFLNRVSGSVFGTYGTAVLEGRSFDERDTSTSPLVCILSREAEKRLFDGHAIGSVIRVSAGPAPITYRVIGVVENSKYQSLRERSSPIVYFPLTQETTLLGSLFAVVRVQHGSDVQRIQHALATYYPLVSLEQPVPLNAEIAQSIGKEQLLYRSATVVVILSLVLTGLGLYNLVTYTVAERTKEIGIRLAMGASRASIIRMIATRAALTSLIGLACGIPLAYCTASTAWVRALIATRTLSPVVYMEYSGIIIILVFVSASCSPALHASSIDPQVALRTD